MTKKICIIYTETNGLHKTNDYVSKKNLYSFARLVSINYIIGTRNINKEFIIEKNIRKIIKPRCMNISNSDIHGITNEIANSTGCEIENVLYDFISDIKDVVVIISHNIDFHLKTVLAEYVRYNIKINITNKIIIDTISFYHKLQFPKLDILYKELFPKNKKIKDNLIKIKDCFLKLYEQYEDSI
jgi:DNA polymerase III epsilon subunit-like protein